MKKFNCSEFLRVIMCNNIIEVTRIGINSVSSKFNFQQIQEVINLCNISKLPIELIISHRSMICYSINSNKLTSKDIISMINSSLDSKKEQMNTIFYKSNNINKSICVSMCECDLSAEFSNILQQILNLNNKFISINVFPFWLVSNFISNYYVDIKKFETVVFIASFSNYWNIIIVNKNNIIYNRIGNLDNFNKDIELKNTLVHLKSTYNINLKNMIIYELEDPTTNYKYSESTMKIVSRLGEFKIKSEKKLKENIINFTCSLFFILFASNTISNFISIINTNNNIYNAKKYLNKFENIVNDLNIWGRLHNKKLLAVPDYKAAIDNYMKNKNTKIQSITMKLNNNIIECI